MRDLVDARESAVVAHPHDSDQEESGGVDNERGRDVVQGLQPMTFGHLQVQHEQGEDDREDAVAEQLDPVLIHRIPPTGRGCGGVLAVSIAGKLDHGRAEDGAVPVHQLLRRRTDVRLRPDSERLCRALQER